MWVDAPITRTVTMHGVQLPPSFAGTGTPAPATTPQPPNPPPPPRGVPTIWLVAAAGGVVVLALFLIFRGGNTNDEALTLYNEARVLCEGGHHTECLATADRAVPLAQNAVTRQVLEELRQDALVGPRAEQGLAAIEAGHLDEAQNFLKEIETAAPKSSRVAQLADKLNAARAAAVAAAPASVAENVVSAPPGVVPVEPEAPASAPAAAPPSVAQAARPAANRWVYQPHRPATATPSAASTAAPVAATAPPPAPATEASRPRIAILDPNAPARPANRSPADPAPGIAAAGSAAPTPAAPAGPSLAPASMSDAQGFLSVTSPVAATVFIDGESTKKSTPLWMFKVKAGWHQVELHDAAGKAIGSKSIEVKSKAVAPLVFGPPK